MRVFIPSCGFLHRLPSHSVASLCHVVLAGHAASLTRTRPCCLLTMDEDDAPQYAPVHVRIVALSSFIGPRIERLANQVTHKMGVPWSSCRRWLPCLPRHPLRGSRLALLVQMLLP